MGQVNSSPRFGEQQNFRVAKADSQDFQRFYITPYTQTREGGGVADPTRPSGPDNRRFETTEGVSVIAMDDTGQMVARNDLPDPIRDLLDHIQAHLGVQTDTGLAKVGEPGFTEALARFAASEYGLTIKTGLMD